MLTPATKADSAHAELQNRPQWVCWRSEERKGKPTKVPYNPRTGQLARSNDPATWTSYEEARAVYEAEPERYQGLGYMFHDDVTGVDLDHCVHPDGSIDPWAQRILEYLASSAEFSPNDGIHVFLRGSIPKGLRRRVATAPHKVAAVEMYSQGRYFTITGRPVPGTPDQLAPVREETPLLVEALAAKNGEKFRALWLGDTTGYLSASEADQALCHLLAFWTGHDPARVDRLFRLSGLYREDKWDRAARAGETYGAGTVARACNLSDEHPNLRAQEARARHTRRSEGGASPSKDLVIPFPIREVEAGALPERDEHPLPETPIDQVLDCLRREEAGDAQLFTHLFRGRYLYDHTGKEWYAWQGHAWKRDDTNQVVNMVSNPLAAVYLDTSAELSAQAAEEARALPPKVGTLTEDEGDDTAQARKRLSWLKATTAALIERARALRTRHRIQNVLALASAQSSLSITSDQWDTNPWLLATPDGVIDLRTGQLHPGQPEDYIRTTIPTRWQGISTPAPRFERFWQEIFGDRDEQERTELIAFLQRALGYGITGHVTEHVFLMLYGEEGRNGKDTLMETLHHVLGAVSGAVSNDVLIASSKLTSPGSAKSYLCSLQGKRVAWSSETSKGARFDVGQVKYLTGGGAISARQLYGRDYAFAPSHLLLLLTNHKPHADAGDAAFWNRLCPILFNLRFVDQPHASNERKRDTGLLQTLKNEASGILAWLVRGCLDWQKLGLEIPDSVLQARQAYRGEEDTLQEFLQECCVFTSQARARAGQLYDCYKAWTSDNNLRALNGKLFGLEMKKRFVYKKDEKGTYYQGIGVLARNEAGLFDSQEPDGTDGSSRMAKTARQADGDQKENSSNDGTDGTFQNFSKVQNQPFVRESYGITRQSRQPEGGKNPLQDAPGDAGTLLKEVQVTRQDQTLLCSSMISPPARDFPFPRERSYVCTPTGIVGYLSRNDRGSRRGVYGLLDRRESHWSPSLLQPLTWEEARAWWVAHTPEGTEPKKGRRFVL